MEAHSSIALASAPAEVALAGNPSDAFGGAVLALTIDSLRAIARVLDGADGGLDGADDDCCAPDLVAAAVARFAAVHCADAAGAAIGCETSIPRRVGLGGSSAIVIAVLRALCLRFDVALSPLELAMLALAVEVEDLGIAVGPQARIAQAFGGLTFMDFAAERYEPLDPAHLPPLLVAWHASAAASSRPIRDDLRDRYDRRDPSVLRSLEILVDAAHEARAAVVAGDHEALARAADASFDARAAMIELDPRHVELVELARDAGASANYAGSGGAIVCVCRDADVQADAHGALRAAGCEVLRA